MILSATADQRAACVSAADLLTHQADGLRATGSKTTVAALEKYAATLRRIAASPSVELNDQDKIDVEQASFVLEGIRDGLMAADFRDRAQVVNGNVRALNEIVAAYNASSAT